MKKKIEVPNAYAEVVLKEFIERGTKDALVELMQALHSFMYVTCSVESEAFKLWSERAQTDRLVEHWKGRQEAAWSIRRHCFDKAEEAMKLLQKLVPDGAWGKTGSTELAECIKRAELAAKKTIARRSKKPETAE